MSMIKKSIFLTFVLAILIAPFAYATEKEACGVFTNDDLTACQTGYGGLNCGKYSATSQLAPCNAGTDQATKDKQNGTYSQGTNPNNGNGQQSGTNTQPDGTADKTGKGECGGTKTEFVSCDEPAGLQAIGSLIKVVIFGMTMLIGIVATGGLAYAAIIYASSRDNSGQTQQAIGIIRNIVIGLVMYGFTIAIVNWLVPGGVIG
jgi:hypothetical protein